MIFDSLKRIGEACIAVTAIGAIFTTLVTATGGSLPPWTPAATGQEIVKRLNEQDKFQEAITLDLQVEALQNAWKSYKTNPDDQNARNDIWRLTREIHRLDPTVPLTPPPE